LTALRGEFMNVLKRIVFILIVVVGYTCSVTAQSLNYQEVFGQDWKKAELYVSENEQWIKPALDKFNIPYKIAIAVIFPELVRYSALRDKMEITLLKALYINLGKDYANFSIGHFQMKPSFAEKIREMAPASIGRRYKNLFNGKSQYRDSVEFRASIVADLEDPKMQLNYLIAFFKICEDRFNLKEMDETLRLKFLATAYNYSFYRSPQEIEFMEDKKFFNTKLFKTENYSYADVSLFWYSQNGKAK
jgi:hypothetical protein